MDSIFEVKSHSAIEPAIFQSAGAKKVDAVLRIIIKMVGFVKQKRGRGMRPLDLLIGYLF